MKKSCKNTLVSSTFRLRIDDYDFSLLKSRQRYREMSPEAKDRAFDEITAVGRKMLEKGGIANVS